MIWLRNSAAKPRPEIWEFEENRKATVSDVHFKWSGLPECLVSRFCINVEIRKNGLAFNPHIENALARFLIAKFHKAEFYRNPLRAHGNFNCEITGAGGLIDLAAVASAHCFRINMRDECVAIWRVINAVGLNVVTGTTHVDCGEYIWRIGRVPSFRFFGYHASLILVLYAHTIAIGVCAYAAANGHAILLTAGRGLSDVGHCDVDAAAALVSLGLKNHEIKVFEYPAFGFPGGKMIGNRNGAANFAPGFSGVAHTVELEVG